MATLSGKTVNLSNKFTDVKITDILTKIKHEKQAPDFKLRLADGSYLACHKVVLSASSDFFQAMFVHNLDDAKRGTLDMSYLDPNALKLLHNYFYSGKFSYEMEDQDEVQEAITFLQVTPLVELGDLEIFVDDILVHDIDVTNCIDYLEVAFEKGYQKTSRLAAVIVKCNLLKNVFSTEQKKKYVDLPKHIKENVTNAPNRKIIKSGNEGIKTCEKKGEWITVAKSPEKLGHFNRGVIDDFNVVFIGQLRGVLPCVRYDLIHHKWEDLPDFPRKMKYRGEMVMHLTQNKLVVILQNPRLAEGYELEDDANFTIDVLDLQTKKWTVSATLEFEEFDDGDHKNCHFHRLVENTDKLLFVLHGDNDFEDQGEFDGWSDSQIEAEGIDRCLLYLFTIKKSDLFIYGEAEPMLEGEPLINFNMPMHVHVKDEKVYAADDKMGVAVFQDGAWDWLLHPYLRILESCIPFSIGDRLLCVKDRCDDWLCDDMSYSLHEFDMLCNRWGGTDEKFVQAHFEMDSGGAFAYTLADLPEKSSQK